MTKPRRQALLVTGVSAALLLAAFIWTSSRQRGAGSMSVEATQTAPRSEIVKRAAEHSPAADPAAQVAIETGAKQVKARDLAAEQQELREFGLRQFAIDYGPFLENNSLSRSAKDTLLRVLGEQFLSENDHEAQEYEKMIAGVLGDKYADFAAYRDRLPREKQADAGLKALLRSERSIPLEAAATLREGLVEIPVNNAVYKAVLAQQVISDFDLDRARSEFASAFDRTMTRQANGELSAYVKRLRDWYISDGIGQQMKILRIQKAMLAGKPFPR